MAEEFWYKAGLCAENEYHTAVRLTEDEHKAVVKFLNQLDQMRLTGAGTVILKMFLTRMNSLVE